MSEQLAAYALSYILVSKIPSHQEVLDQGSRQVMHTGVRSADCSEVFTPTGAAAAACRQVITAVYGLSGLKEVTYHGF